MSFLFGVLFKVRSLFSVVQKWWHAQEFLDLQHIRLTKLRKHELFVRKLQQKRCPNHQELVTTVFLKTQVTLSSISQLPRVTTISGASYRMAFYQWFISDFEISNESEMPPTWELKHPVNDAEFHRLHSLIHVSKDKGFRNESPKRYEMITMIYLGMTRMNMEPLSFRVLTKWWNGFDFFQNPLVFFCCRCFLLQNEVLGDTFNDVWNCCPETWKNDSIWHICFKWFETTN